MYQQSQNAISPHAIAEILKLALLNPRVGVSFANDEGDEGNEADEGNESDEGNEHDENDEADEGDEANESDEWDEGDENDEGRPGLPLSGTLRPDLSRPPSSSRTAAIATLSLI